MRDRAVRNREAEWADLMRAAIADDRRAYERLLRELACVLRLQVCRALLRGGQAGLDPEDVVQEILLAVHLKRHTWRPDQALSPWVRAIAHYKTVDAMRRRGWRVHVPIDDFADSLSSEEPQPQAAVHDIARQLDRLPAGQREVVRSISIAGASIAETAARLDMTQGAVRVALHRGLTALAKAQER